MHFQRPAGGGGHVGHPRVVAHHHALARFDFGVHDVLEQVAAGLAVIGLSVLELGFHLRCDERIAVDLAVRVRQRHADFGPVVLEREDLLDAFRLGDFGGAERPRLDHRAQTGDGQVGRQTVLVRVEADDFAAPRGHLLLPQRVAVHIFHRLASAGYAHHRGEAVLEDDHIVVGVGHFAVLIRAARLARGQRIARGRGTGACRDRAVHARGGHRDPVAGERVAAHFGRGVRHFLARGV